MRVRRIVESRAILEGPLGRNSIPAISGYIIIIRIIKKYKKNDWKKNNEEIMGEKWEREKDKFRIRIIIRKGEINKKK